MGPTADDPELAEKEYVPFVINRCLSNFADTVFYANDMNQAFQLDKKLQYDFFLHAIPSKKRFSPWSKKDRTAELKLVSEYYNYSEVKAEEALRILTAEELVFIREKMDTGGVKK